MTRRLPPIDPVDLTAEQAEVQDLIAGGPRGGVRGPFLALMQAPAVAPLVADLGEYVRYRTSLDDALVELAVLVVVAERRADYAWTAHARIAAAAGVGDDVIEAIRQGSPPPFEDEDQRLVHAFSSALQADRRIPDEVYSAAVDRFGLRAVVELATAIGYFNLVAAVLNAFEIETER